MADEQVFPISRIAPGTPEMERRLQAGYPDMTVEKAKAIVKEFETDKASWPWSEVEKARAFLAAYKATPRAVDNVKRTSAQKAGG